MTIANFNTAINKVPKPSLLESVKQQMITSGYSKKTIEAYTKWIKEFILFNDKKHPKELRKEHVEEYLTFLAVK